MRLDLGPFYKKTGYAVDIRTLDRRQIVRAIVDKKISRIDGKPITPRRVFNRLLAPTIEKVTGSELTSRDIELLSEHIGELSDLFYNDNKTLGYIASYCAIYLLETNGTAERPAI